MAYSSQRALSDGTLSDIELTIEYIDRVDLKLFVDSVQIEDTVYSYEFITDNLIRITPNVAAGEEVLIQRQTRLESVLNVYADGAVFNNSSMDENFRQMLLIAQEAREGATLEEIFNDLNMHGYSIRNLADGVGAQDAVNKRQLDGVVTSAAAAAAVHASAASASATLSQRWANEAEDVPVSGGLYSAKHWAAKSEGFADAASLSADDAEAAALLAQNNQVPLCGVIWWPTRSFIPSGFIAGDGVLVSRASFPSLWALVNSGALPSVTDAVWLADPQQRGKYSTGDGSTTFRVPDYNGKASGSLGAVFLRGDGALSAAVAGAIQLDEIKAHVHGLPGSTSSGTVDGTADWNTGSTTGSTYNTASVGGAETRPLNVTGCHIIKAFGAEIDPGTVDIAQLAADVVALTGRVQTLEGKVQVLEAGPLRSEWVSAPFTDYAAGVTKTFTHTLPGRPRLVEVWLRCTSPVNGFVLGEEVRPGDCTFDSNVANTYRGSQVTTPTASTLRLVTGATNTFQLMTASGSTFNPLPANFEAFIRAYR